jgi:hypothetical protein
MMDRIAVGIGGSKGRKIGSTISIKKTTHAMVINSATGPRV